MRSASTSDYQALLKLIHVWHVSPDKVPPGALHKHCLDWLTPPEKARRSRLRTERLRHEFLVTRVLCRVVLSHYAPVAPPAWRFRAGTRGKPAIARPSRFASLRFNLTHTEGLIACAVTRAGEVGIDAEDISR